jgi:hypothetical protein
MFLVTKKIPATTASRSPEPAPNKDVSIQANSEPKPPAQTAPAKSPIPPPVSPPATVNIEALSQKYQSELDILAREGTAKFQFVDYAPPSFVVIRNQAALQVTLRNPDVFDKDSTSIYRRAARAFDLFLAPRLTWIISKIPETPDLSVLDISIVNDLVSAKSDKSSEAIEFIFPLKEARQFVAADITNQDLIDRGIVLVNSVRIALNLAQVE